MILNVFDTTGFSISPRDQCSITFYPAALTKKAMVVNLALT